MKRLLMAVVLGLACFGCSNECDDAESKLEECGVTSEEIDTSECDGANECAAKCVNKASCDDIKNNAESYVSCIFACAGA
jgi:hypothetical protein